MSAHLTTTDGRAGAGPALEFRLEVRDDLGLGRLDEERAAERAHLARVVLLDEAGDGAELVLLQRSERVDRLDRLRCGSDVDRGSFGGHGAVAQRGKSGEDGFVGDTNERARSNKETA